jgi:hypothetical protein
MFVFCFITIFEASLFPQSILSEHQFNPAILYQQQFGIIASTGTNFGLPELRTYSLYSQIKSYSISFTTFGNELYRENIIGLGFGFPLMKHAAVGFNIFVLNYSIKEHYSHYGFSLKFGAVFQYAPFEFGAWINNINVPKFSDIDYVPPNYSIRCGFRAADNVLFNFAIRGVETDMPFFNIAVHYSPYTIVALACGVNTDPLLLEYGLKIHLGDLCLSYAGNRHRQLGLSHRLSAGFGL